MAKFDTLFTDTAIKKQESHPRKDAKWIHYTKLKSNEKQYRTSSDQSVIELAALIEASGCVLQNLIVRKSDADEYEIIAGHHRRAACKYLVETKGLEEYAFLPCEVKNLDDVVAEFQLYSSNGFVPKTDYERMVEIERMKFLLENYPEAFPHIKEKGRMVERLSEQLHLPKSTVGEYLSISSNLGDSGKQAFKDGQIKKSAAVALAGLTKTEQNQLIDEGKITHTEIKKYKETKRQTSEVIVASSKPIESTTSQEGLKGQLAIVDTSMRIDEEELQEDPDKNSSTYDIGILRYFLRDAKERLNKLLATAEKETVDEIDIQRLEVYIFSLTQTIESREKNC